MALLNSWGKNNKIINSSKIVYYTQSKLPDADWMTYGSSYNKLYTYTRICTYNFEYVGMDLQTATNCCNSLVSTFTRTTWSSKWSEYWHLFTVEQSGTLLMSGISIQKMNGGMYKVVVQVNETDSRTTVNTVTDVAGLFSLENSRDYLENES